MPNICHIGLGKTGTTTLQKHIFPNVAKRYGMIYNDRHLCSLLRKSTQVNLSETEVALVRKKMSRGQHFISLESLASWNPSEWECAANQNLSLFGKDTKILITLREPKAWMKSVYQQKIHEGNIIAPEKFFLTKKQYLEVRNISASSKLEYFCSDYLSYAHLHRLYSEKFSLVECVDLKSIKKMNFLESFFKVDKTHKSELIEIYKSAKNANRAYSNKAMKLTFSREKILRIFGVKTVGSSDWRLEDYERTWTHSKPSTNAERLYGSLSLREKFYQCPSRGIGKVLRGIPSWRRIMQGTFDHLVKYEKYELPDSVYMNKEKIEECKRFLESIID